MPALSTSTQDVASLPDSVTAYLHPPGDASDKSDRYTEDNPTDVSAPITVSACDDPLGSCTAAIMDHIQAHGSRTYTSEGFVVTSLALTPDQIRSLETSSDYKSASMTSVQLVKRYPGLATVVKAVESNHTSNNDDTAQGNSTTAVIVSDSDGMTPRQIGAAVGSSVGGVLLLAALGLWKIRRAKKRDLRILETGGSLS